MEKSQMYTNLMQRYIPMRNEINENSKSSFEYDPIYLVQQIHVRFNSLHSNIQQQTLGNIEQHILILISFVYLFSMVWINVSNNCKLVIRKY